MKKFSLNQKLAVLALTLAFLGLVSSFVSPDGVKNVNQKPNYISVVELAKMIQNREELQLFDLRTKELFDEFHIPTARHFPLDSLLNQEKFDDGLLVFYSGDDVLSRRMWQHLPGSDRGHSFIVYGGIHDWYDHLLYPELPRKIEAMDSSIFRNVHDLSLFYGGQAEFVEEQEVMDYYRRDLREVSWPKSQRENALERKGC